MQKKTILSTREKKKNKKKRKKDKNNEKLTETERNWKKLKETERNWKIILRENERKCALLPKEYWSAAKKGTPECTLCIGKSGKCRNDKNGPLQNVHFFLEKLWSRPRMCGFHGARVPFRNVHHSL